MNITIRVITIFLGLLLLWQIIISLFDIPFYLLPTPHDVFISIVEQLGLLYTNGIPTLLETLFGFLFGILFGALAAFAMAFFKPLKRWFLPMLIISQAVPTFAIAPLLVLWFGYGIASKIAITVLMIFFPVTSAFYDGLTEMNTGWNHLAKTMNANRWRMFFYIRIPAALPALAKGVRIAAVIAPIGAVIGEWVGSSHGLGYLMLNANARMQIDVMFAALFVIVLLALTLYFTVDKLLRELIWW